MKIAVCPSCNVPFEMLSDTDLKPVSPEEMLTRKHSNERAAEMERAQTLEINRLKTELSATLLKLDDEKMLTRKHFPVMLRAIRLVLLKGNGHKINDEYLTKTLDEIHEILKETGNEI